MGEGAEIAGVLSSGAIANLKNAKTNPEVTIVRSTVALAGR